MGTRGVRAYETRLQANKKPSGGRQQRLIKLRCLGHSCNGREFLDLALPPGARWSTFPAGGGGLVRGAQLKARGLKPGVPDILICYRSQTLAIELKRPKGSLSDDQKRCHAALRAAGITVATCHSVAEVETFLKHYCAIPLVARVAA